MIISADHLLTSVRTKLEEVRLADEVGDEFASVRRGMLAVLEFLHAREQGRVARLRARLATLLELADNIEAAAQNASAEIPSFRAEISRLLDMRGDDAATLEFAVDALLLKAERLIACISQRDTALTSQAVNALVAWDLQDVQTQLTQPLAHGGSQDSGWRPVTLERLRIYLRAKFDEPRLEIDAFKRLAGGFGKETVLFTVDGRELSGDFVLRRDKEVTLVDNDCHRICAEYKILKAVHGHGVLSPNALWLEEAHALLPGADFIVMDRADGSEAGDLWGARKELAPEIAVDIAVALAKLHALPPLNQLGSLSNSIRPELWQTSIFDTTYSYLSSYFDLFLRQPHFPSVAAASQFRWLLNNVPVSEGLPCLLHGDVGLHNMLSRNGRITALLDWEFSHIGDPAEELAYVKNYLGPYLDWEQFMNIYVSNGGASVTPERIKFFQVWGFLRNAVCGCFSFGKYVAGEVADPAFMLLAYEPVPKLLQAAQQIINGYA